jgi:hypothetical protein
VTCEKHSHLKQFENDWATADLVKQYLHNSRKYLIRQRQDQQVAKNDNDSQHDQKIQNEALQYEDNAEIDDMQVLAAEHDQEDDASDEQ